MKISNLKNNMKSITKNRISKEEMFMQLTEIVATRSTCLRLSVGAIITDCKMSNILSIGYNGNYAGGPNTCDSLEEGFCGCTHAEINSLVKADNSVSDRIMFVTDSPCKACAKIIINSQIAKVYYRNEYRLTEGINLLKKVGIKVIHLK